MVNVINDPESTSLPSSRPRPVADERFAEEEMAEIMRGFARRLREAFDGATNADIARRCITTSATIKLYAEGKRLPIAEMLLQMTRTTGVNIHWLLTGRGSRRVEIANVFSEEEEERIRQFAREKDLTFDQAVKQLTLSSLDLLKKF